LTDVLSHFALPVSEWFRSALGEPTTVQALGWPKLIEGKSALLLAPTGSGKTLAAFLVGLDRLMFRSEASEGVRLLYVSPQKALAVDVERNLQRPLSGIREIAESRNAALRVPTIALRSGDTPALERARFRRKPSDILITTPESLYLLLTSDAARHLASVETVIIDEIHSVLATKRGAHLALSLERLQRLRQGRPLQRIGLSATVRPVDEAAALLAGGEREANGTVVRRAVAVIDATRAPNIRLSVEVPVRDMDRAGLPGNERSIWGAIHSQLVELVKQHRSTLIFVNNRGLAERLSAALNDLCGEALVLAHHGAVARERRREIEELLKNGRLRGLVATSSLELGIDMGAIDLVVQIEAPSSVASGLQRVGRSGHYVGGLSKGIIFPKYRGDLLAAAAAAEAMQAGKVEDLNFPRNPLDVLAQQAVAIVANGEIDKEELFECVTGAAPFFNLTESAFSSVLELLSGRYPSDAFSELRPRITWDRATGKLTPRQGAKRIAIVNGGTIPDRGLYGVFLADSSSKHARRVGELDEEMVFESRIGDVFLLGASSWRIEDITPDRVLVAPAPGQPGRMPFWHGDRVGRSLELGKIVGQLARSIDVGAVAGTEQALLERGLQPLAAETLITYVRQQREASGTVPSDTNIVVETFRDELGDFRVCLLSPFGSRVHAPWAIASMEMQRRRMGHESQAVWSDDGIVFRFPEARPPALDQLVPSELELDELLQDGLAKSPLFATYFRENAARALLLPRRRPGQRTPLWAQRRRATDLLSAASQFPDFPILLETFRECLRDVFDVPGLKQVLAAVARREVHLNWVNSSKASPFAASLLFAYSGNFIYDTDAPLAERRAQALLIDQAQLRDLLGETEIRHLLDEISIAEVEQEIGRHRWHVRHADDLHDLLLQVGDLTWEEIASRSEDPELARVWLSELERTHRVVAVRILGEVRWSAVEDVSRLRDAIGISVPTQVPVAFLRAVKEPLNDLVGRFARTRGPFVPSDFTNRYPVSHEDFGQTVANLEREGRLVRGKFLPRGTLDEWCDVEVLRRIKQKSLARLRRQVEPIEHEVYARFLLEWQGAANPRRGEDTLLSSLLQLQGVPMGASVLESDILPARVLGYHASMLDELMGSGEIVWRGIEPLGAADGHIALFAANDYGLWAPAKTPAVGALADAIRQLLREQGASFFAQLVAATQAFPNDLLGVLWSLVWSGEVTNDTLAPVRSRLRAHSEHSQRRHRSPRHGTQRARLPGSEGRWWLLERLMPRSNVSDTERVTQMVDVLLERYGVLPREALGIETLAQFSEVYPVMKALEEAGRIRRGFFVKGLAPTQFALPGADDRLRLLREPNPNVSAVTLSATDPANPYGAVLPWPENESRPQRAIGARVIILDGTLIGYVNRSSQGLITFCSGTAVDEQRRHEALISALRDGVDSRGHGALTIREINGQRSTESPLARDFLRLGFVSTHEGLLCRPRARHQP
jgi:ATP-dependent helicase Lhr and Lhr-like helicase